MNRAVLISSLVIVTVAHPKIHHDDCSKVFNPQNYLTQLPSLSLPYISNLAIPAPYIPSIEPSPVATTKVINIVTKYVTKSPVCIKVNGKKPPCSGKGPSNTPAEYIVTKEYFVKDRKAKQKKQHNSLRREHKMLPDSAESESEQLMKLREEIEIYRNILHVGKLPGNRTVTNIQGSESPRFLNEAATATPTLNDSVRDMLIEDRLDKLEDILPHYKRLRVYQTSTITITKTRSNNKATATLMVRNCIPEGMQYCKVNSSSARRKSKVDLQLFNNALQPVQYQDYNQQYQG